jgi:molybdopterin synthase catalytic subunit
MRIELRESPFDPYAEVSRFQSELLAPRTGQYGATSLFVGTMRDFNEGDTVEIAEGRPISRSKSWTATKLIEAARVI